MPLQLRDQLKNELKVFVDNIQQAAWDSTPDNKGRKFNSVSFKLSYGVNWLKKKGKQVNCRTVCTQWFEQYSQKYPLKTLKIKISARTSWI